MSKRVRLCDSSTHDKCPGCTFDSLKIRSYSYVALKSLQSDERNFPPNESIVSSLQRTFERTSVTLNDLIFANKCVLKRMEDVKAVIDATIENISLVLRPLPSLPDDILVAIFHWCLQGSMRIWPTDERNSGNRNQLRQVTIDNAPPGLSQVTHNRCLLLTMDIVSVYIKPGPFLSIFLHSPTWLFALTAHLPRRPNSLFTDISIVISIMSTIASLPNTILVEIFKSYLTLPKDGLDFHDDLRFVLLAVCRDWRALMVSVPSLWNTIEINDRSVIPRHIQDSNIDPDAIFYRPYVAFQYARDLPLDLTIELPTDNEFFNLHYCALLSKVLQREAPRIWSLTVTGDDWNMHYCALRGLQNVPMPQLRSFIHDAWTGAEEPEGPEELLPGILQYPAEDEFTNLDMVNQWGRELYPNLTYLEISGAPYDFCLLPTSGLRAFGLCFVSNEICPPWLIPEMLEYSAATLEDLWLIGSLQREDDDDEDDDEENVGDYHIDLPKLKRLFIEYEGPDEVADFLPSIRAPALEQLELSDTLTSQLEEDDQQSSDDMLTAMMHYLPLDQLQRLMLTGVVCKDEIAIPEPSLFLVKGKVSPQDVPVTLRFLASLTSLRVLSLCLLEDDRILSLLNYPRTPNFGENGEVLPAGSMQGASRHLPLLPALECLHLSAVNTAKAAQVHQFMDERAEFTVWERMLHVIVDGSDDAKAEMSL